MMKKEKLCILIFTAISISFFFISFAFASNNESCLIIPKEVFLNESFNASINSSINLSSDVKIFVKEKSANEKSSSMLSLILDKTKTKWINPYYYIENSFPLQKTYIIKIVSFSEKAEICLKLRSTANKKILLSSCQPIKVINETNRSFNEEKTNNSAKLLKFSDAAGKIEFQTKENKIRKNIFLAFLLFLGLVLVLILLRKI